MSFATKKIWDVVVIGGGPAGIMAAATAAQAGAKVLLLEKNQVLGKKLSITGGGRCNVTNNKPAVREMLASYTEAGKFLFSTFTQHGVVETIAWFGERGVAFKEENEGRLFPVTGSAETIRETLVSALKEHGVTVLLSQSVLSLAFSETEGVFTLETATDRFVAKTCVLGTGGLARPETGSTGDGFAWLTALGHTVTPCNDALVPVALKTAWIKELQGLTLENVKVSVWAEGKKQVQKTGRILITHFGVSGPLILNLSKRVSDLLAYAKVTLLIDLFPQYDAGEFKAFLHSLLQSNKKLHNALATVLPEHLVTVLLKELSLSGETPCHSVRTEERKILLRQLKAVPLEVSHLLGADKAIISSGGVALEEVDFKTMSSKVVPGLFIVGDLLNINRPSGGYSLQLCWSTGFVAGMQAGKTSLSRSGTLSS